MQLMKLLRNGMVRRSAPWFLAFLGIGIAVSGGVTFWRYQQSRQTIDLADLTTAVTVQDLAIRVTASGVVQPIQHVNLSPRLSGRLEALYVEQGDQVTQGQVLAQMQDDERQAELLQVQGSLEQAQARLAELEVGSRPEEIAQAQAVVTIRAAQILEARSRLELALGRLERNQALREEGAIAQDALDAVINEEQQARANLEQALAQRQEAQEHLTELEQGNRAEVIAQAAAQVKQAQGRLNLVAVQLRDAEIRAPFPGIVTQKYAEPGAFVTPTTSASSISSATSTAILAIARDLEVLAKVPEVDIGQIYTQQSVEIVADGLPDQVFAGRVKLIAPVAIKEQNVTLFEVRVALESGQQDLRSGMNVNLTFLGQPLKGVLAVPTVAIVTREGETGVLVPGTADQPQFQSVTLGATLGDQTQILHGVAPGDQVFIDLPSGTKLKDILEMDSQAL